MSVAELLMFAACVCEGDLNLFPDYDCGIILWREAKEHLAFLKQQKENRTHIEVPDALIKQQEYAVKAWDILTDAAWQRRSDKNAMHRSLRKLRDHLGDDYYRGVMPHPIQTEYP